MSIIITTGQPVVAAASGGPVSIWHPVHLGTDETGAQVHVTLAERNMLIGGEPGGGKSVALQLIVAHGALSAGLQADPDRRQAGRARPVARLRRPVHRPARSMTRSTTLQWLQEHDRRAHRSAARSRASARSPLTWGWPVYLVAVDEIAYYSATVGTTAQQNEFSACNRDVVARGRAPGIIPIEATQRPSADIMPDIAAGPVRLPVGVPLLHRRQLRHHPRSRHCQHRLHRHRHQRRHPRRRLAPRRRQPPAPPRQVRLPHHQ